MHELDALTPESLRELIEREQTILRQIAFHACWSVRNPGFKPMLDDSLQRLNELSPEARELAQEIVAGGGRKYGTARQLDKLEALLAERCVCHWLYRAVDVLAPRAQQVVLPELIQHYECALEEEPRGLPHSLRMARTLKRLGPAHKIARELARVHLTKVQESGRMSVFRRCVIFGFLLSVLGIPWETSWISLRMLGMSAITPLALMAILRCLDFRKQAAWIGQLELSLIVALLGAFRLVDICWASEWNHKDVAFWSCFLLSGIFGTMGAVSEMRDRHRKLLRLAGIGGESSTPGNDSSCRN